MSLDDRLTQLEQYNMGIDIISEKPFTPKDHHAVYPELKTTQQAILSDLLEIIFDSEDRSEAIDKVRKYCE